MLARWEQEKTFPKHDPYPIAVWKLGDGPRLIFLGGEVVVDYSLRLKAEMDGQRNWVAGYTNDVMNYIPSRRVFCEGGYEGLTGMFTDGRPAPWTPAVEETIIAAVHRLTRESSATKAKISIQRFGPNVSQGISAAVSVADAPLVHTGLILRRASSGVLLGRDDARSQTRHVLQRILADAGSGLDQLVQLNVYTSTPTAVKEVQLEFADFLGNVKPPATFVAGDLPPEGIFVSLDAVAASLDKASTNLTFFSHANAFHEPGHSYAAILPPGEKIYLAGWIDRGDGELADVGDATLQFQIQLLRSLGCSPDRVVRIRAFMNIEAQYEVVRGSVARVFHGQKSLPPVVYAPWQRKGPSEIEVVAAGRRDAHAGSDSSGIEYHDVPDLPASPVFSRAARVTADRFIYVSGITAEQDGTAVSQIRNTFDQLQTTLQETGSDLRQMVKATYWLADGDAAKALGAVRRKLYDPERPPAASAFTAQSVGFPNRVATVDIIAIANGQ